MSETDADAAGSNPSISDIGKYILFNAIYYLYQITIVGVVFHEFAHQLLVSWRGYRVREVDYLSHVVHDKPRGIVDSMIIAYAPLLVNTIFAGGVLFVAFGFTFPMSGDVIMLESLKWTGARLLALYFSFSLLFHAVPSLQDIQNIVDLMKEQMRWYRIDLALIFLPLLPLFVPVYWGLLASRKTKTRSIVDISYVAFAFASFFGVVEWWTLFPVVGSAVLDFVVTWVEQYTNIPGV